MLKYSKSVRSVPVIVEGGKATIGYGGFLRGLKKRQFAATFGMPTPSMFKDLPGIEG